MHTISSSSRIFHPGRTIHLSPFDTDFYRKWQCLYVCYIYASLEILTTPVWVPPGHDQALFGIHYLPKFFPFKQIKRESLRAAGFFFNFHLNERLLLHRLVWRLKQPPCKSFLPVSTFDAFSTLLNRRTTGWITNQRFENLEVHHLLFFELLKNSNVPPFLFSPHEVQLPFLI